MSHHHHHNHPHESKLVSGLKSFGSAVKRSPQLMRKKFGGIASRVGRSKHYSSLEDCESNGWIHSDEQVMIGVPYEIKYLGSMEIDYVPHNPQANNLLAAKVMHKIKSMNREVTHVTLTIAAGRITLTRGHSEILMRHSTSRIAYSTVDTSDPKLFCYVALPRSSKIALCHVFRTKSAKKSYELTFTCAHAFNLNFQRWQKSKSNADLLSNASESGDVEPANPMRSPEVRRRLMVVQQEEQRARASSLSKAQTVRDSPTPADDRQAVTPQPGQQPQDDALAKQMSDTQITVTEDDGAKESEEEGDGEDNGAEEEDLGYIEIEGLEVEDEDEIQESAEHYFSQLADARSEPSLLDIGVAPEQYNRAKAFDDDSSDEDDDE